LDALIVAIVHMDHQANDADWQLWAHMCLPNNLEMREDYRVTQAARAKQKIKDEASRFSEEAFITAQQNLAAKLGRPLSEHEEEVLAGRVARAAARDIAGILVEIEELYSEPHGGDGRLTRSPGIDAIQAAINDGARKGRACGEILWNIAALDKHHHGEIDASYNRAVSIMVCRVEAEGKGQDIPGETERHTTLWRVYGPVAPLWAAWIFCKALARERDIPWSLNQWLEPIIRRSLWFANFTVGFKARKSDTKLLTEDRVIRINPELGPIESLPPPFGAEQLEWARRLKR
jgi:hypothetical protein